MSVLHKEPSRHPNCFMDLSFFLSFFIDQRKTCFLRLWVCFLDRLKKRKSEHPKTVYNLSLKKKKTKQKYDECGEIATNTKNYNFVFLFYLGARRTRSGLNT